MKLFINNLLTGNVESWLLVITLISISVYHIFKIIRLNGFKKLTTPLGSIEFGGGYIQGPTPKCIIEALHKQLHLIRTIDRIELRSLPRDLMNTAENTLDNIIYRMQSIYMQLLKEKYPELENPAGEHSYNLYKLALSQGRTDVLHALRHMIHENNFINRKENGTWLKYKQIKTANLIDTMSNRLDVGFICDNPTRQEVHDINKKTLLNPDKEFNIHVVISSVLEEFLKITQQAYTEIEGLEAQIQEIITGLFKPKK